MHEHVCPLCTQEWDCSDDCGMSEVIDCGDCEHEELIQIEDLCLTF